MEQYATIKETTLVGRGGERKKKKKKAKKRERGRTTLAGIAQFAET